MIPEESILVYRYLLSVHALACLIVLFQHLLLGFIFNKESTKMVKAVVCFCLAIPLIQLVVTTSRFLYTFSEEFKIKSPLNTYIDFFWSPMCTIMLIWFVQLFLARTCNKVSKFVPPQMVQSPINGAKLLTSFVVGIFLGFGLIFLQSWAEAPFDLLSRVAFSTAIVMSILESMIYRWRHRGGVTLTSYTIVGYFGTFAYYVQLFIPW